MVSRLEDYYRSKMDLIDREASRVQWYNGIVICLPALFHAGGDSSRAWQALGRFLRPADRLDAVYVMLSLCSDSLDRKVLRRCYIETVESLGEGHRPAAYGALLGEFSSGVDELMEALEFVVNPVHRVRALADAMARGESSVLLAPLLVDGFRLLETDETAGGDLVSYRLLGVLARLVDDCESFGRRVLSLDIPSSRHDERFSWIGSFLEAAWGDLPDSVKREGLKILDGLVLQEPDAEDRAEMADEVRLLQRSGRLKAVDRRTPVDQARCILEALDDGEVLVRADLAYRRLNLIALAEFGERRSSPVSLAQVNDDLLAGVAVSSAGTKPRRGKSVSDGEIVIPQSAVDAILASMETILRRGPRWVGVGGDDDESSSAVEQEVEGLDLHEALLSMAEIRSHASRHGAIFKLLAERVNEPRERLQYLHLVGPYFATRTLFEVGEYLNSVGDAAGQPVLDEALLMDDWFVAGNASSDVFRKITHQAFERLFDETLAAGREAGDPRLGEAY